MKLIHMATLLYNGGKLGKSSTHLVGMVPLDLLFVCIETNTPKQHLKHKKHMYIL